MGKTFTAEEVLSLIKSAREEMDDLYNHFDPYDPDSLHDYSSKCDKVLDRLENKFKSDIEAGVMKRIDYHAMSMDISEIIYFCDNCDPGANGGHGGILARTVDASDNDIQRKDYCPTCGAKINWAKIQTRQNWLR